MMVGIIVSFWDGLFSGAMLNFQGVHVPSPSTCDTQRTVDTQVLLTKVDKVYSIGRCLRDLSG